MVVTPHASCQLGQVVPALLHTRLQQHRNISQFDGGSMHCVKYPPDESKQTCCAPMDTLRRAFARRAPRC